METVDFYHQAHLWVAGIRILEFKTRTPPAVDALCELLTISLEQGQRLTRKLEERGIIQVTVKNDIVRCSLVDHLRLEAIPSDADPQAGLAEEVAKYKAAQSDISHKVASFQAERAQKQKDLFAELNAKLKGG